MHSQRSVLRSGTKCAASHPFHFCWHFPLHVVKGLRLRPLARHSEWKLVALYCENSTSWADCLEGHWLFRDLSSITAFAFNCTVSLFLSMHQLSTWRFHFEKGTISEKMRQTPMKKLILIIKNCLSNKTLTEWCAILLDFNAFKCAGKECY